MGKEPLPVFVFGCTSCGKTVAGNEKSCPRCGVSFDEVKFECPFCGELISPSQRKCPTCGTEFGAFSEEVSEKSLIDLDGADVSMEEISRTKPPQKRDGEAVEFECPVCGKSVSESDTKCPHCSALFS